MTIDNEYELGVLRQMLLDDHLTFTRYFFKERKNQKLILNSHHYIIAKTLDRVFSGEITRLIVNIAPRYTKTEQVVLSTIARGFAINPRSEFIHASYADSLVMRNSSDIRNIVQHSSFQRLWPLELQRDSKSKRSWRIQGGGGLLSVPSGGTITGFGAGLMEEGFTGALVIDDPMKPRDAYSEAMRQKINNQMTDTFLSRLAHKKVPIIVVMQRIHENDMTGFLLDGGTGEKWYHLCLPCEINDEARTYDTDTHPWGIPIEYDLPDGALWPYKHTLADLANMRKSDPYTTAAQYDQRPAPLGGGLFKDEWWKYYNAPPNLTYRFITGDTAQKTAEQNDYSVFACWGVYEDKLYLLDVMRGKWESPELRQSLRDFYAKHRAGPNMGDLRGVHIEDKSSGTDLIQTLGREMPIIGVQRGRDKISRAMDCIKYIAGGQVYLPENAHYLADFKMEVRKFTPLFTHTHDDQVDVLMDAIDIALMIQTNEAGAW